MAEISIGQAIHNLMKQNHWDTKVDSLKIERDWEKIMGKTIAKYTDKLNFYKGQLVIYTKIAPLKQELQIGKQQIIDRINEYFKEDIVKSVMIK